MGRKEVWENKSTKIMGFLLFFKAKSFTKMAFRLAKLFGEKIFDAVLRFCLST
jgi:hypothetical protein